MPQHKPSQNSVVSPAASIPELEQAKRAALSSLTSVNTRRGFNRAVVLRYRSFLESLQLSAATVNLHLSAIRSLADEATASSLLSPELAIGIRRVKGLKRLGRRIGNWLTQEQAQSLLNAIPTETLAGRRDAAVIGLLLGCGLRRSEVVALRLDQLQSRDGHWVIVDLLGKAGRLRTVPMPDWCKALVDTWLCDAGVVMARFSEGSGETGRN